MVEQFDAEQVVQNVKEGKISEASREIYADRLYYGSDPKQFSAICDQMQNLTASLPDTSKHIVEEKDPSGNCIALNLDDGYNLYVTKTSGTSLFKESDFKPNPINTPQVITGLGRILGGITEKK